MHPEDCYLQREGECYAHTEEAHFAALRDRLQAASDQHDVEDWSTTTSLSDVVDEWVAAATSGPVTFRRLALGVLLVDWPASWRKAAGLKARLDAIASTSEDDARGSLAPAVARAWRRVLDDVDALDNAIEQEDFRRRRSIEVAAAAAARTAIPASVGADD